jgi:MFS family permease
MVIGRPRIPDFAILLGAAFAVSMAFGVTLPLLPSLLGRILGPADTGDVARHTGWLTGAYTLAMFALAPAWGALSDRIDRRLVMLTGLIGSALSLAALDFVLGLPGLYAVRIASGIFSAAVLPAVLGTVVDLSTPADRNRRFGAVAAATAAGFLAGPAAGSALAGMVVAPPADMRLGGWLMLDSPFLMVAFIGLIAAAAVTAVAAPVPRHAGKTAAPAAEDPSAIRRALLLTGLVVFGITIIEVGITLLGTQALSFGVRGIGAYFALCSLVMIAVQAWGYPWLVQRLGERALLVAAFLSMAAGLALLSGASAPWQVATAVTLGAAGVGVLIPALAARISGAAGNRQGLALGQQSAAANAGQAAAAGATGMLYASATPAPFLVGAAALIWGAWLASRHRAAPCPSSTTQ